MTSLWSIQFESAASTYSGLIEDGKYKTGGQKAVQGIPPGEYKVWISGAFDIKVKCR